MRIGTNRPKYQTRFPFKFAFGSPGTGSGQFDFALCVAIDPGGSYVYVVEDVTGTVSVLDLDGTFIRRFGQGLGGVFLADPRFADAAANGNLYVADGNSRVRVYNAGGTALVRSLGTATGFNAGQLFLPSAVSTNSASAVYVLDIGYQAATPPLGARVQKWAADGTYVGVFLFDSTDGFTFVAVDKTNDDVYTATTVSGNRSVVKRYTSAGTLVSSFTWPTLIDGLFIDDVIPGRLFLVQDGIFLAEGGPNGISVVDPSGVKLFGKFATGYGDVDGRFKYPTSARTHGTRLYVSDYDRARVSVLHNAAAGPYA